MKSFLKYSIMIWEWWYGRINWCLWWKRKKTGEVITKREAHKKGIWHSAVHLFIVSIDRKKTLLQQRCEDKELYANYWDIAVGGHISSGEDGDISVRRELEEELKNGGVNSKEFVFDYIIYADKWYNTSKRRSKSY